MSSGYIPMAFFLFLLIVVFLSAALAMESPTILLADHDAGEVSSISLSSEASDLHAEYFGNNPISDVCMDAVEGLMFTAGAGTTMTGSAGDDPSTGGHIAVVDITGIPQLVAQFSDECTAIECDYLAGIIVVAVANTGICACSYDGADVWDVVHIVGSNVQNIFIDVLTQTCYFVDMATSSVYAVNYMVRSQGAAVPIGSAGAGAVGCTLDYADGQASVNILYSDCKIERCPIDGAMSGCQVLHPSTGGSCVALTGTKDSVTTHDNQQQTLIRIEVTNGSGTVTSTATSSSSITGLSCPCSHCQHDIDFCDPNPCLNTGTCVNLLIGYSCTCPLHFTGRNCENGPADLIALMGNIKQFDNLLSEGQFPSLTEYFSEDTIIDFLDYPQFRGREGHDELVSTMCEPLYTKVVSSASEIRQLCDLCYEDRFTSEQTFAANPDGPTRHIKTVRVWCFNFEAKAWEIKLLVVVEDKSQNSSDTGL